MDGAAPINDLAVFANDDIFWVSGKPKAFQRWFGVGDDIVIKFYVLQKFFYRVFIIGGEGDKNDIVVCFEFLS